MQRVNDLGSRPTSVRDDEVVLDVRNLVTEFESASGKITAVDGVSFTIGRGEILGIVGESGSGKSVTAKSIMGLLERTGRAVGGEVLLQGVDLLKLPAEKLRELQGDELAMVFQNPLTSLNPAFRIGWQLREAVKVHRPQDRKTITQRVRKALLEVGISRPEVRERAYPHEFSGGMRQRVVIAAGILNEPALLIADEPTTALDVTIQAQVLDLLKALCRERGLALMLITHNMGVVANMCDRVAVMYAGEIVEVGDVFEVFNNPKHPYTAALLQSMPDITASKSRLPSIPGSPPDLSLPLSGCRFLERCGFARDACATHPSLEPVSEGHLTRCWVGQSDAGPSPWLEAS